MAETPVSAAATPISTATPATYGSVLWANLVSLAVMLWFCVRNLSLALEAQGRPAALLAVPSRWIYGAGLALAAAGLVAAVVARARRLPPGRPCYRLLPVLAVVFLGLQVFALPTYQLPMATDDVVLAQASILDPEAFAGEDGLFTVDAARVAESLKIVDAPFVDARGEPVGPWRPVVHAGCGGPATDVPAAVSAGAVLYCVSADRTEAWLSFVGIEGLAGKARIVPADEEGATATVHWTRRLPAAPGPSAPAPAPDGAPDQNE